MASRRSILVGAAVCVFVVAPMLFVAWLRTTDLTECGSGRCGNDVTATLRRLASDAPRGTSIYTLVGRPFLLTSAGPIPSVRSGSEREGFSAVTVYEHMGANGDLEVVTSLDPLKPTPENRETFPAWWKRILMRRGTGGETIEVWASPGTIEGEAPGGPQRRLRAMTAAAPAALQPYPRPDERSS
jgi:hypothetical protein